MTWITDANTAVARVAYQLSEVLAVYPITPSTSMAESCEQWASQQKSNLLGDVPKLVEMQSEAGSIAVVHGAAMSGALATTFTSSQGLLLMIPSLYKLAGELTPCVIHVAARTVATHALSIYCDHSDVMAIRQTGVAMLCASNAQETQDLAAIATFSALQCRLPFVHFFDGFLTSHAITQIEPLSEEALSALLPMPALVDFRARALTPDRPTLRGATADPDSYFQCREAQTPYHQSTPKQVQNIMNCFETQTGRRYQLVEYIGHPQAQSVIVAMGSSVDTIKPVVLAGVQQGERIGVIQIRLYRPFPSQALRDALPATVTHISVLDRTKEPGSHGEPLYLDVLSALYTQRANSIRLSRGRYGLSGKAFYPEDVEAIFTMMQAPKQEQMHEFVVGIEDDVSQLTLPKTISATRDKPYQSVLMYGYGGDGSVSAGKNLIKTLGQNWHVQGQFEYDSKKSANVTTTHIRFSQQPITAPYPVRHAWLVSLSNLKLLHERDIASKLIANGYLLLNTALTGQALWVALPPALQSRLQALSVQVATIDADGLVERHQLGNKTSIVMQAAAARLLSQHTEQALLTPLEASLTEQLKHRSAQQLTQSLQCLNQAYQSVCEMPFAIPSETTVAIQSQPKIWGASLVEQLLAGKGYALPVSAYPADGVWPTNTSQLEKRNLAEQLPVWETDLCTQCGYCVAICPHSAIRARIVSETHPTLSELKSLPYRSRQQPDAHYVLQVSPDDCTGCQLCTQVCPAKDRQEPERKALNMVEKNLSYQSEQQRFIHFQALPKQSAYQQQRIDVKTLQHVEPYFEYPNACAGCGETPYIRILTQLFGDRLMIANATGCSSIFGGNLPTTPYSQDSDGRGPAWANSLFEDNAEFGLGMNMALEALQSRAQRLLGGHTPQSPLPDLRSQIGELKLRLPAHSEEQLLADYLSEKMVWMIGGDGWAYDIGFGGLDHVMRSGRNINILVLDTQCYSNTGGQKSKSTPQGQTAKLCSLPNPSPAKDLVKLYQDLPGAFVARIALGANINQTIKALQAAGEHSGPSLVVAYSPCIEHHYDLAHSAQVTKEVVKSGAWPLYAGVAQQD
ncbi:pyruvate:ferredoxin (flavodoxin) oxidoreductase [Vibrio cholerae]|nr:pyruvate:ferredoxin (flavodoxin) oxidoreductase [Vibrio cholerae]EKF9273026.1 pyruvate:ferredoxin (flavodoxin) oxidoreductase [Vibrio cholerae]EKF9889945.1 pyruvate:ferredoxin (flavodoxin) oxidoreductase [Vibrio cholerae]